MCRRKFSKPLVSQSGREILSNDGWVREITSKLLKLMVIPTGFEPVAYRLGICRSILLSYGTILSDILFFVADAKSEHHSKFVSFNGSQMEGGRAASANCTQ